MQQSDKNDINMEQIEQAGRYAAHLITCAISDTIPEAKPEYISWKQVYRLCKKHSITSTVYPAIQKTAECKMNAAGADRKPDDVERQEGTESLRLLFRRWKEDYQKAIVKELNFDVERAELLEAFEQAKIRYLPLKGILLKDYYPGIGMRMFADNDILYQSDQCGVVKQIMRSRGYQIKNFGKGNHDVYMKEPIFNFELHRQLVIKTSPYSGYCSYVWERAKRDENRMYGYHMTTEDSYLFFLIHAYKHYTHAGTGLRTVLDQYLFLNKEAGKMDWEYIKKELTTLSLTAFEQELKELGAALFSPHLSDIVLTGRNKQLYDEILGMGTFGTLEKRFQNQFYEKSASKGSLPKRRYSYYFKRLFPGKEWFHIYYPVTKRFPILYPFVLIKRLGLVVLHWKKVKNEIKTVQNISEDLTGK